MKLFEQLVRTAVNVISLPISAIKDAATLGGTLTDHPTSYTQEAMDRIKREAAEDPERKEAP